MSHAKQVINALANGQPAIIPRFNKATDNPHEIADWTIISEPVDLIIFEGWCWGVEPQNISELDKPINDLEQLEDEQGYWRNHTNLQLTLQHKPLYSLMDQWIMLKAPSFADIFAWRLEQEQKLMLSTPLDQQTQVMDKGQIARFIQHYQRLTEHALQTLPNKCNEVFSLNSSRQIIAHQMRENHA
jgi:D-glycerate 3-kinase